MKKEILNQNMTKIVSYLESLKMSEISKVGKEFEIKVNIKTTKAKAVNTLITKLITTTPERYEKFLKYVELNADKIGIEIKEVIEEDDDYVTLKEILPKNIKPAKARKILRNTFPNNSGKTWKFKKEQIDEVLDILNKGGKKSEE